MDELLKEILSELKEIKAKFKKLEEGQTKLEEGQSKLKEGQTKLEEGQEELKATVSRIENTMQSEFKNLKESDSAMLGLIEKTYKKAEQIDSIADDINFLLKRNAKHDNEIRELRKIL